MQDLGISILFKGINFQRLLGGLWVTLRLALLTIGLSTVLGLLFAPAVISLFRADDPEVIRIGALAMRLQCVTMPSFGYVMIANMMMQTTAQTTRASLVALSRQGLFFLPLIAVLPLALGLLGIQLAQPIADGLTFILAFVLQTGLLKKIKTQEQAETQG